MEIRVNILGKVAFKQGESRVDKAKAELYCDDIEKAIGMEHGGEPSAYLMGWVASCINKARLGIGDFVEIKDKKE
nr:MAG TPA: hypothetical protein [Caudoviricetes sp.]